MKNKLIPLIMTLVVGIILAGSLLVPILGSAAEKDIQNIQTNEGNEYCVRMAFGTPDEDLFFTKPVNEMFVECRKGSVDAEPYYTAPLNAAGQLGWVFCSSTYSLGITGYGPKPLDYTARYNDVGQGGYIMPENTLTVKIDHTTGHITTWGADPSSTWDRFDNADVTKMFWADPNGDYINVNSEPDYRNYSVYIETPKSIAGSSQTQANYIFYTNTDDVGVTNNKPATVSTETIEWRGLYKLTSVPMQITGADDSVNNVHSGHVIVKYQVQGTHLENSGAIVGLMSVIPIMVIIALLVVAVGVVARRNE